MTKVAFAFLVLIAMLAGCDQSGPAEQAPAATSTKNPVAAMPTRGSKPIPAPAGQKGMELLTQAGVEFAFPHAVMYDILDASDSGTPRHRVLVEILDGDFAIATGQLEQSLTGLGYAKTSASDKDGRIEQVYVKKGKPAYYLLMQPAGMGPKVTTSDSAGSIHIMWNIP